MQLVDLVSCSYNVKRRSSMRNEMMHRPVVKEELLDFMRTQQKITG